MNKYLVAGWKVEEGRKRRRGAGGSRKEEQSLCSAELVTSSARVVL